ncbi:MAG: hypothetical protein J2P15_21445, partial [Micromonosporaceae bacterium]|nr:hypothetical protein [Micromonosporaceae bacterium]
MDSTLAQSIAVATHTTMWLAESRAAAAGSQVAPAEGGAPLRIPELVDVLAFDSVVGVEPWAQRLAEDGVDRVWLAVPRLGIAERSDGLPAHIAGAFLGGTPVGLLTTGRAGNQLWHGQLQFGERVVDHAQVVVAHYRSEPVSVGPARLSAGTVAAELDRILARAAAFAEGQQLLDWARRFTDARGRLADGG